MAPLYLFGDRCDNFGELVRPFLAAAGAEPQVAVAHIGQAGWSRYLKTKVVPQLLAAGAAEVVPVGPEEDGAFDVVRAAQAFTQSQAILMGGGDTARYHRCYVQTELGDVLRRCFAGGTPYAGISAGAMLAGEQCCLAGSYVDAQENRYVVRANPGQGGKPVRYGRGLGLLPNTMVEPHCGEWGSLPRLLTGVDDCGLACGIGIDECACVAVESEQTLLVTGRGRAYLVTLTNDRQLQVRLLDPGTALALT